MTLIGAAVWSLLGGSQAALGALVGGGISVLLSLYFAVKFAYRSPEGTPQLVLAAFFRAEGQKFILGAVLFGFAAVFFRDAFLPVMTTFAATLLVYGAALLWIEDDRETETEE